MDWLIDPDDLPRPPLGHMLHSGWVIAVAMLISGIGLCMAISSAYWSAYLILICVGCGLLAPLGLVIAVVQYQGVFRGNLGAAQLAEYLQYALAALVLSPVVLVIVVDSKIPSLRDMIVPLVLGVLPLASALINRSWRRTLYVRLHDFTLCRGCGYDLRETEQRCPECGRPLRAWQVLLLGRRGTGLTEAPSTPSTARRG
jgi:hypothetical protein